MSTSDAFLLGGITASAVASMLSYSAAAIRRRARRFILNTVSDDLFSEHSNLGVKVNGVVRPSLDRLEKRLAPEAGK